MVEYGRQHGAQSGYGQLHTDEQIAEFDAMQGSTYFRGPFKVEFTINYETKFGENFRMTGSLPELGEWDLHKSAKLKWTTGHNWIVTIETSEPFFFYKYVIVDNNCKALRWEEGENRIADVRVLCIEAKEKHQPIAQQCKQQLEDKHVVDKWGRFTIKYSIYYPLMEGEYMRINGDTDKLGAWNKGKGPVRMVGGAPQKTLTGVIVKPWEIFFEYNQQELAALRASSLNGMLTYKYSIRNDRSNETIWEREPSRYCNIQNPDDYQGELGLEGSSKWPNKDRVFIVNGMIDKVDANFVGGLTFNKIGDTGIYIGPYPQTHDDAKALYSAGVTGVLNVQTEIDHAHRSIDWQKMEDYYRELNIEPVWFPIHDFNATDLESKIYEGAQKLNDMLTRELKVYVHCTAGMGRAPAVVLTYLSIFKDMDPTIADLFVKSYRSVSAPNLPVVKRVAEKYGK